MGEGNYINNLVKGVREQTGQPEKAQKEVPEKPEKKPVANANSNINEILETMRNFEIKGDYKRLIRIDERNEDVLKLLSPLFKVDVTSFVNFLCSEFLKKNPQLIKEMKQTLKKL